ncbi:hypothetical protein BJ138DRAFT_1074648 [Hygrophoropsis aurantiaca]|uniref:Uncharacterized protein n=1 Tax=Hygrophoropsis aurantiaca TaxID=72124 RepID=A0ACB8ATX2_9AGAM|nr:hypothetical protein BJ138DRAFT_1074648 [Hygrophoropsis aurantiaca]
MSSKVNGNTEGDVDITYLLCSDDDQLTPASDSTAVEPLYTHGSKLSLEDFSTDSPISDPYDRSEASGKIALAGVAITILLSLAGLGGGIYIAVPKPNNPPGVVTVAMNGTVGPEVLSLVLAAVIVICVEAVGYVHSVTLRTALASESRLRFNTNLRLLTASRQHPWTNPNGTLFNALMGILVTISYASVAVIFLHYTMDGKWIAINVFAVPVIILSLSMLFQAVIALAGLRATRVLTWSPSSFDTTAAMLHQAHITHYPKRCMCGVLQPGCLFNPQAPAQRQPSAWRAHRSVRKVVITLWVLVLACLVWGGVTYHLQSAYAVEHPETQYSESLAFFPNPQSRAYVFGPGTGVGPQTLEPMWALSLLTLMVVQSVLAVGLHCSELIVNIIRDEQLWRRATKPQGTKPMTNPLTGTLGNWLNVFLLVAKSLLHWMFGLTLTFQSAPCGVGSTETCPRLSMYTVQIWYLAIALFVFALGMTIVALRRPHGPQPAAYGHIQTLANLVDEWYPTMWWGHKEDGAPYCHAGTSDHPLPPVKMNRIYAGPGDS